MEELTCCFEDRQEGEIMLTHFFLHPDQSKLCEFAWFDKRHALETIKNLKEEGGYSRKINIRNLKTPAGVECWLFIVQFEDERLNLTGLPLASFFGNMIVSGLPFVCFDESFLDVVQRAIGRD